VRLTPLRGWGVSPLADAKPGAEWADGIKSPKSDRERKGRKGEPLTDLCLEARGRGKQSEVGLGGERREEWEDEGTPQTRAQ